MSSLVPRLPPSCHGSTFTANDGKLHGRAWGTRLVISDSASRMNLAARTCRRQHGHRRRIIKEWPSSKNRNATLPFCQ